MLASPEAGKLALLGGAADIMVADWLWVSRERALGSRLVFHPDAGAAGAVMVPVSSPIHDLADLKGRTLGVAGGPLDLNWLLLRGAARREGFDLALQATVLYGASSLLAAKTADGELDATLNTLAQCADLEARGFRRAVEIADVVVKLGAAGRVAALGYVFDEGWAARNRPALERFLAVSRRAKELLASSDAEWDRLAPAIGARDKAALAVHRDRYRASLPRREVAEEEADARVLYRVLLELGGAALVGPGAELDPGTFHKAAP